ncbi:MAG: hypothetical protein K2W82_16860 [Candidatus Obscuribacterales bacterium]|nr:hypothetical protein [Candidatus Obscuribacterales bacterium]
MIQSFPPSILKILDSFYIDDVSVSSYKEVFNLNDLKGKIRQTLVEGGLTVSGKAARGDAHLCCTLIISPCTYHGNCPTAFAFACHMYLLCAAPGCPETDLYCVFSHTGLGTCSSERLNRMVTELLVEITKLTANTIVKSRR